MKNELRTVTVQAPSFPEAPPHRLLSIAPDLRWQVLCGDTDHWRVGVYSPPETCAGDLSELERHDCPEFFLLLSGRLTLVLAGPDGPEELALLPGRPVLVTAPHGGFCPDGPHSGAALVVERDAFTTEYRALGEWEGSGT